MTSFQKVTLFLQNKIFDRDVIRLHFGLFEDVNDCRHIKNRPLKVLLRSESSFLLRNNIKTNIVEIKL